MSSTTRKDLEPSEVDLVGQWVVSGGRVNGDEVCERIEWLIAERLARLGSDPSGWDTLYRDPRDGRLWEHTYPQSHMHGGGPPRLQIISPDIAAGKYSL